MVQCVECGKETAHEFIFISIPKHAKVKKETQLTGPELIGAKKWMRYTYTVQFDKARMKKIAFGLCDACQKNRKKGWLYAAIFWTVIAIALGVYGYFHSHGSFEALFWISVLWIILFGYSLYSYKRKVTDSLVYSIMYEGDGAEKKGGFNKDRSPRFGHYYYIDGHPDINDKASVKQVMDDCETPHLFKVADYEKMLENKPILVFKDMQTEVTCDIQI